MRVTLAELKRRLTEMRELDEWLKTGISLLDEAPGLQFGALTIFYGPPGAAKTSLLSRIALNLTKQEVRVVYVPYEEGVLQFFRRVERHCTEEADRNLILPDDGSICSYPEVVAFCEKELDHGRPAVLILDSIQSFKVEDGNDNHADRFYSEVGELLRYAVGKKLALFFVSEETSSPGSRHPKGTAGLRYKPNVLVHLSLKDGTLTLKIEKDRNGGRKGKAARLRFDPMTLRFTETDVLAAEEKARAPKRVRIRKAAQLQQHAGVLRGIIDANPGATKLKLRELTGFGRTHFETVLKIVEGTEAGVAS